MKSLYMVVAAAAACLSAMAFAAPAAPPAFSGVDYGKVFDCGGRVRLTDAYQMEVLGHPYTPLAGGTLKEKFVNAVDTRIRGFSEAFANDVIADYDATYNSIVFASDSELPLLKSGEVLVTPDGCVVRQAALGLVNGLSPRERVFDNEYWTALSDQERVALLLSTILLDRDSEAADPTDFVRLMMADQLASLDIPAMADFLYSIGYNQHLKFAGVAVYYSEHAGFRLEGSIVTPFGLVGSSGDQVYFKTGLYSLEKPDGALLLVQGKPIKTRNGSNVRFYKSGDICALALDEGTNQILTGSDGASYIASGGKTYAFTKDAKIAVAGGAPVVQPWAYCDAHYND